MIETLTWRLMNVQERQRQTGGGAAAAALDQGSANKTAAGSGGDGGATVDLLDLDGDDGSAGAGGGTSATNAGSSGGGGTGDLLDLGGDGHSGEAAAIEATDTSKSDAESRTGGGGGGGGGGGRGSSNGGAHLKIQADAMAGAAKAAKDVITIPTAMKALREHRKFMNGNPQIFAWSFVASPLDSKDAVPEDPSWLYSLGHDGLVFINFFVQLKRQVRDAVGRT